MKQRLVYKLFRQSEWRDAESAGTFAGSPDDRRDGFIHLSTAVQVRGTFAKHFAGDSAAVLVSFPAERLGPALKWEISRNGELFPHLYAALDLSLAVSVFPIRADDTNTLVFPPEIA